MEKSILEEIEFVVGCDADGILTDLTDHNLREGEKVFKRKPVNPDGYSLEEQFDLKDISKVVLYSKAFKIYINYCKNEKPRENAPEVINELTEEGLSFHSITARKFATSNSFLGSRARKWFKEWLKKYNISFSSFNFCSEERSPQDKLLACKKLNADAMVEDKPDVALYLAQNGIKVVLITTPYNKGLSHENITRVDDWNEVKSVLRNMKQEKANKNKVEFQKKEKEEISSLSNEEKVEYFDSYKSHLKNLHVNVDAFKKGDRKFKLIYSTMKWPIKLFCRVEAFNKENIPYQDGFILASNHLDSTDQYKIGLALGNRPFVGFAAKEIEDSFRGKLFKTTGLGIFVDRNDAENKKEASELMANYVSHDRIALIFPEGTRKNKSNDGKTKFQNKFKLGTVALAQKTGTGILPVAINNYSGHTIVSFGEFMYVNPTDDLVEANRRLELAIATLNWKNAKYYLTKKKRTEDLEEEYNKYLDYYKEEENSEKTLTLVSRDKK